MADRSLVDGDLTPSNAYRDCSAQSAGELEELAQHVDPASIWADIQALRRGHARRDLAGGFPAEAPLGEIDCDFLAAREFTDSQIKTVDQTAAGSETRTSSSTTETDHLYPWLPDNTDTCTNASHGRWLSESRWLASRSALR